MRREEDSAAPESTELEVSKNRFGVFDDPELEESYMVNLATGRLWWIIFACFALGIFLMRVGNFFRQTGRADGAGVFLLCALLTALLAILGLTTYILCIRRPMTATIARRSENVVIVALSIGLVLTALDNLIENLCEIERGIPAIDRFFECRYRIFGLSAMQSAFPLLLLKVRGIVTLSNAAVNFFLVVIFAFTIRQRNVTDVKSMIGVRCAVYSFTLMGMAFAAVVLDQFRRQSFLALRAMEKKGQEAAALEKQVQKTLTSLVPQETISRVLNKEPVIDSNTKCCVGVFQIYDYATWSTTRLPHECVEVVDSMFCEFDRIIRGDKKGHIEKVLMTGDIFVFSLGLRTRGAAAEPAERKAPSVGIAVVEPVSDPSPMLTIALKCIRRVKTLGGFGVQATAGVATGACVAALFGTKYLRYNLLGPAFDTAMSLSQHAVDPMSLSICDATQILLPQPPQFTLQRNHDSDDLDSCGVWTVSFRAKRSPMPRNISQSSVQTATSPASNSVIGADEVDVVGADEKRMDRSASPVELTSPLSGTSRSFDSLPVLEMAQEENDDEEQALLDHQDRALTLRDQFLSAMGGTASSASVGGQRQSELVDDKAGLEPKFKGCLSGNLILDFTNPELESNYWQYCNETAETAVLCDFVFSFAVQTMANVWLTCHEETATWLSILLCFMATFLSVFRGLMWKLELLPPDRAALYFVPAVVLQTGAWVGLLYVTNGRSHAWPTTYLPLHISFLQAVAGHNVPVRWAVVSNGASLIVAMIPTFITQDFLFIAAVAFIFLTFMLLATIPLVGWETDRRRAFISQVLTQRLEATAKSHMDAHKEILQMVIPSFVISDAVHPQRKRSIVKEVPDLVLLSLRLSTSGPDVDVEGALKLYAAAEAALSGTDNLVLVQAVGNQLLLAGPMVESDPDELERALKASTVEMATTRFAESHQDGRSAMRMMLSIAAQLRRDFGPALTAVLASGSGFASVIGGSNPTFEITGVAKRLVVALMNEAPPSYCGATNKAMQLLQTYTKGSNEEVQRDLRRFKLRVEPDVRWRLRGIGFVTMVPWKQREEDGKDVVVETLATENDM